MINIGLIGCGWVSHFYGKLAGAPGAGFAFAWAADADLPRATAFCGEFGGLPYANYLDAPLPDAYIIATPHHLHSSIYLALAGHGKPVLMEKPLALSVAECDSLIETEARTGATIMVGYVNRYRTAPRVVKAALQRGAIGDVLFSDLSQFGDQEKYVGGWILKRETLGGGCFFSSAGHLLDLGSWLHGPIVRARLETGHFRLPMEGEDTALALVRYADGSLSTVRESWCAQGSRHWQQIVVYGSTGSLEMTYTPRGPVPAWQTCLWDATVTLRPGDGSAPRVLHNEAAPFEFAGQMQHFLECVTKGSRPQTDALAAREIIRVVRQAESDYQRITA